MELSINPWGGDQDAIRDTLIEKSYSLTSYFSVKTFSKLWQNSEFLVSSLETKFSNS